MRMNSLLKKAHLIKRNREWLSSPLPTSIKFSYYLQILLSVVMGMLPIKKRIRYLNNNFYYDNFATPLSLQAYPYEISRKILDNLPAEAKVANILDIGGNVGQFSVTMSYFLPTTTIDVLEPNPDIFKLLDINSSKNDRIRVFNYGIGEPGTGEMFYTPGKSATGSIFNENVTLPDHAKKIKINLIDDPVLLTGTKNYDLVKIDVEGYEYDLLKLIKNIKPRFMFIEVSSLGRYKDFWHSELFCLIEKRFGKFDVLHLSEANSKSDNFDILLRLEA